MNVISTPVRWMMFRKVNEVSGPLCRTPIRTPLKLVGACCMVTESTDPGRSLSGCDRLKSVSRRDLA